MKKVYGLLLTLLLLGSINTYAQTPTLQQIAESFNNSTEIEKYKEPSVTYNATVDENQIVISSSVGTAIAAYGFPVNGTIMSADIRSGSNVSNDDIEKAIIWYLLVDSVGKLHGYEYGDLLKLFNSDDIEKYTLENQGYEMKKISEEKYECKLDISKKIPLMDYSNTYFEVSDLEEKKELIYGDGSFEDSKGNVWFNKSGYDGINTLLVAEKDSLTDNTYKSILSIITVMFDSTDAANYFKKNYPKITSGTKEFDGIKIEVNPAKDERESNLIPDSSNYKFLRIKINKKEFLNGMKSSKGSTVKVPNTTKSVSIKILITGFLLILVGAGTVYNVMRNRNVKEEF